MSDCDAKFLNTIARECYFRMQPQPIIDLLNQRGIVGRTAEVFWTYFHWGFQSGSFQCQLSSAYVAELLFTEVRNVQRANEKLQKAGLIKRFRAKRAYGTSPIEAPAITKISIPDAQARTTLYDSPRRAQVDESSKTPSLVFSEPVTPMAPDRAIQTSSASMPSPTTSTVPLTPCSVSRETPEHRSALVKPSPSKISAGESPAEFTAVNSRTDRSATTQKETTGRPTKLNLKCFDLAKSRLPQELQKIYDLCMIKAAPSAFRSALKSFNGIDQADIDILIAPLEHIERTKKADQIPAEKPVTSRDASLKQFEEKRFPTTENKKLPNQPRLLPRTAITQIRSKLQTCEGSSPGPIPKSVLSEIIYSITIGTMRGTELVRAINATIKLVRTRMWAKPRGMPEGWEFGHVLAN